MELSFGAMAVQCSAIMGGPEMTGFASGAGPRGLAGPMGDSGATGIAAPRAAGIEFADHMQLKPTSVDHVRASSAAGSTAPSAEHQSVPSAGHVGGVADRRVTGGTTAAPPGLDLFEIRAQRQALTRELQNLSSSRASGGDGAGDGRIRELESTFADLFNLQLQVQDMSLRAEMASKLAEHATSSTKTVLQTQT